VNRELSTRDSDPVGVKHSAMCGTGSSKLSAACLSASSISDSMYV
jgi:hypothetical protein